MKSKMPTVPIYSAAKRVEQPEDYDRLTRKDFWNDPDRWEGIADPRETMIWEVRRPDRIDVRGKGTDTDELRNMMAVEKLRSDAQSAVYQSQLQQSMRFGYLNRSSLDQYGSLFGSLFGY